MGSININYEGKTESHEMKQLPEIAGGSPDVCIKSKVSPIEILTNRSSIRPLLFDKEYWFCGRFKEGADAAMTLTSDSAVCKTISEIPRLYARAGYMWEVNGNEGDLCTLTINGNYPIVQRVRTKNGLELIESLLVTSSYASQTKLLESESELVFLFIFYEPAGGGSCSISSDASAVKLIDGARTNLTINSYLYLIDGDVGSSYTITANSYYIMFRCKVL